VKARTFPPNVPIRLSYRIWIHQSDVTPAQLKQAYDAYAAAKKAK